MAWAIESRRVTAGYPPPSRGRVGVKAREKGNLATYGREKLLNSRNVGIGGLEPGAHGIHRQMRRSESTPVLSLLRPGIRRAIGYANAPFDADAGWITSSRPRVATNALKRGPPLVVRRKLREPTIGQRTHAFLGGGMIPDFSVPSSQPGIMRVSAPYPMKAMCSQRVISFPHPHPFSAC